MKYFNTLPYVTQKDINGNDILVNNLVTRAYFLPSLLKNVTVFYDYDIREEDTAENIAYKYYNDPYRYWLLFYSNNTVDPQEMWPLSYHTFNKFIISKYKTDAATYYNVSANTLQPNQIVEYTQLVTHHYEEKLITYNSEVFEKQVITYTIDENTYNTNFDKVVTSTFGDGTTVTKETERRRVSIYDYEYETNESKRKIQLLRDTFVNDAEKTFKSLMGT